MCAAANRAKLETVETAAQTLQSVDVTLGWFMHKWFILTVFAPFMPIPTFAAPTTLTAMGIVTDIGAIESGNTVVTPPGSIKIGDTYTFSATFDPSLAELNQFYDANPTIGTYFLPGTMVTYTIGSYSRTFMPLYHGDSFVRLGNNFPSGDGSLYDIQSFSFFDNNVTSVSSLPFDLGTGQQSAFVSLDAFDFTDTARTNDLISQLAPPSAFNSKSFSFGQVSSNLLVSVQGNVESEAFTAVPEPATWKLVLVGLGAVILTKRHLRRSPAT